MENRFERLYGFAQRSLVKNIRKELSDDESLTMGILLFHSFSEGFYYESTVKNTLIFPDQIKKKVTEKEIWNYEMLFYLAKYMSLSKTKSYIRDLMEDNNILAKKDASIYAIAYNEYEQFKCSWLDWVDKELQFTLNEVFVESHKTVLNSLFYFANYLLSIIKYGAYTTYFNPQDGSFREQIYRVVIGDYKSVDPEKIDIKTAELKPKNDYKWHRPKDTQISYSELAFVLEICFKQPFSVKYKIDDIKSILKRRVESPQKDLSFCAMAKPLQYNGEFQGIIYVTKNIEKGTFKKNDSIKFKTIIHDFHIESIFYSSRFDTARYLLENLSEKDINIHPFIRILNCQHLFSTAPLGLLILPETGSFVRYREEDAFMQTRKIDLTIERISKLLRDILNIEFIELIKENNCYWLDIDSSLENKFGRLLNDLLGITEDLFIKSFTFMKFMERNVECYYFLFSFNHIVKKSHSIKQSYALRTHNDISKLLDTALSAKRMYNVQNTLMKNFHLDFFHDEKNFISTEKGKLSSAFKESSIGRMRKSIINIIDDFDIKESRYNDYLDLLREQFDEKLKSKVSKKEIETVFKEAQENINNCKIKFTSEFQISDKDYIQTYLFSLKKLINEIIMNAVKQYSSYYAQNIRGKKIVLRIEKIYDKSRQFEGFSFYIFNSGTEIPESIIDIAGDERINNGSNKSTSGMGFVMIKNRLKMMNAARFGAKYFQITNEASPKGVAVRFSLPNK